MASTELSSVVAGFLDVPLRALTAADQAPEQAFARLQGNIAQLFLLSPQLPFSLLLHGAEDLAAKADALLAALDAAPQGAFAVTQPLTAQTTQVQSSLQAVAKALRAGGNDALMGRRVDAFLQGGAQQLRDGSGSFRMLPQEGRTVLEELAAQLAQWTSQVRPLIDAFLDAEAALASARLTERLRGTWLQRGSDALEARAAAVGQQGVESHLRLALFEVLSAQSALKVLAAQHQVAPTSGVLEAYADALRPPPPLVLRASGRYPVSIRADNMTLRVWVDGMLHLISFPLSATLQVVFSAEPYKITRETTLRMKVNGVERSVVLTKNHQLATAATDTDPALEEAALSPQDAVTLAGLLAPVLPEFTVEAFGPAPQRVLIRSEAAVSLEFLPVTEGVSVFGTLPGVVFSAKKTLPSSLVGTLDYADAPLNLAQVTLERVPASFRLLGADVSQVSYEQVSGPAAQVGQVFVLEAGAAAGQYVVTALTPGGVVFDRPINSSKPVTFEGALGWPAFELRPTGSPRTLVVDPTSPAISWFFQPSDPLQATTLLTTLRFSRADFPYDEEYAVVVDGQLHTIESRSTEGSAVFLEIAPGLAPSFAKDLAASGSPLVAFVHRAEADYRTRVAFLTGWVDEFSDALTDLSRTLSTFLVSTTPAHRGSLLLSVAKARTLVASMATAMRTGVGKSNLQVRELFRTLREKGLDRAIDLLKSGQFDTFFSISAEEGSTSGYLAVQVRTLAQQDLPQTKFGRTSRSRLTATIREPDAEFTSADIDALGVTADEPLP